ncbi:MAG: hypothetical protein AAFY60_00380, partial [Myxococcota bacterium]
GIAVVWVLRPEHVFRPRFVLPTVAAGVGLGALMLGGISEFGPWHERGEIWRTTVSGVLEEGAAFSGLGPEGFSLYWPKWRERFQGPSGLALTHAHCDPLQWWVDYGILGLLLWCAPAALVLRRWTEATRIVRIAGVSVLVLSLAGLVQPTLVQVPSALLMAGALGVIAPNTQRPGRGWIATVGVLAATVWVVAGLRLGSEWKRSTATRTRVAGASSLLLALDAARWDESNDRAWLEVMMASDSDVAVRQAAARRLRVRGLTPRSENVDPRRPGLRSRGSSE